MLGELAKNSLLEPIIQVILSLSIFLPIFLHISRADDDIVAARLDHPAGEGPPEVAAPNHGDGLATVGRFGRSFALHLNHHGYRLFHVAENVSEAPKAVILYVKTGSNSANRVQDLPFHEKFA